MGSVHLRTLTFVKPRKSLMRVTTEWKKSSKGFWNSLLSVSFINLCKAKYCVSWDRLVSEKLRLVRASAKHWVESTSG